MSQRLSNFTSWPESHDAATVEAMSSYYLVNAAWHSGRLNAITDLPRPEFLTSAYASNLSYAVAELLKSLRDVAPETAEAMARHIYEVVDSGEGGEWIWEALTASGRTDADAIISAGAASVPVDGES